MSSVPTCAGRYVPRAVLMDLVCVLTFELPKQLLPAQLSHFIVMHPDGLLPSQQVASQAGLVST